MKEYHLFYAPDFPLSAALPSDDSNHAVRVLRMKEGDELRVTDGVGNFYDCTITMASRSNCLLQVDREHRDTKFWKGQIHLVVAPTKNMDRMEWLAEKATEIGMDRISFIDCKNSERRVVKTERIERIVISAMKQSHKAWKPLVDEMCPFVQFLKQPFSGQRFIAHCYDMDDGDSMNDAAFMQSEARHTVFLRLCAGGSGNGFQGRLQAHILGQEPSAHRNGRFSSGSFGQCGKNAVGAAALLRREAFCKPRQHLLTRYAEIVTII